ncbi:MAG: extensin family protein [Maricaulaceae bacterium]
MKTAKAWWLRLWRILSLKRIVYLGLILAGFCAVHFLVPTQHVPWRSLQIDKPLGAATKTQLSRLDVASAKRCTSMIDQAQYLKTVAAKPHQSGEKCGWENGFTSTDMHGAVFSTRGVTMQCPLTIGTYIWTREINRLAQKYFDTDLKTIHHAGTYSCRRQKGNSSNAWSEHAFANAFDIMAFELADGQIISIKKDWNGEKKKRRFLHKVRNEACNIFRVTLSPDYNAAHADHLHIDMGPAAICR